MSITRRAFVKSGGLALFSLGLDPLFLARAAYALRRPSASAAILDRPVLVCLFQRGAVDGLNMIVPHGDPLYYQERPRIAVPESDVVDLDGYFGLHPRLAADAGAWAIGLIFWEGSPRRCDPAMATEIATAMKRRVEVVGVFVNPTLDELARTADAVGLSAVQLGQVFERFYRADPSRSRQSGGVGLGLSIVKHIAQLHGGRAEAESELGKGTTVRVILPGGTGSIPST